MWDRATHAQLGQLGQFRVVAAPVSDRTIASNTKVIDDAHAAGCWTIAAIVRLARGAESKGGGRGGKLPLRSPENHRSTPSGRYSGASGHALVKRFSRVVNSAAECDGTSVTGPPAGENTTKRPQFLLFRPTFVTSYFSRGARKIGAQLLAGPAIKIASAVTGRRTGRTSDESGVVRDARRG